MRLPSMKHSVRERQENSRESSIPTVKSKRTHVNQAPWMWKTRRITL